MLLNQAHTPDVADHFHAQQLPSVICASCGEVMCLPLAACPPIAAPPSTMAYDADRVLPQSSPSPWKWSWTVHINRSKQYKNNMRYCSSFFSSSLAICFLEMRSRWRITDANAGKASHGTGATSRHCSLLMEALGSLWRLMLVPRSSSWGPPPCGAPISTVTHQQAWGKETISVGLPLPHSKRWLR